MREKVKMFAAVLLLMIMVPYMVTLFFHEEAAGFMEQKNQAAELEEKLLLLVSEEISGQAEVEAIKAQAVIARTELYVNPALTVVGNTKNLQENMEVLRFCVEETEGEILTCQGVPIDAAYHRVSAKITRNGAEVSGQEDKSYLRSVDSSMDIASSSYLTVFYMEKEELAQKIEELLSKQEADAELESNTGDHLPVSVNPDTILSDLIIVERDSAQYVTKVKYETYILSGESIRDILDLSSSAYYFSELNGKVRIMTKGLGHGLGLSQYGAEVMAKEGKTYREILKYYYTGVEITKI